MTSLRACHSIICQDKRVYAFGGLSESHVEFWQSDADGERWMTISVSPLFKRMTPAICLISPEKILLFGGMTER